MFCGHQVCRLMNYPLLFFFILHLAILNVFFISQFLISKYKHLFLSLCLSIIILAQALFTQQQIKIQKQQIQQAQKEAASTKQIQLSENINTIKLTGVSPEELDLLKQNLEQTLELKPDHRDILFNLGIVALYQQNDSKAAEYFSKSRYQDPNNPMFLGFLAK